MEEPNKKIPKVETFAEDMAEVIRGDRGGLIKKIIHEEEAHDEEKLLQSPDAKRNKIFAFSGSLLLLLAVGLVGYIILSQETKTSPVETPFTSIIFNDETAFIEVAELNRDQIMQSIRTEVETKEVKLGGVDGIYLTLNNSIVGLRQFGQLINSNLNLVGNDFVDDNFLLGFVNNGGEMGRDFFILIQMRSFVDIFDNMRAWEAKMFSDLYPLFGIGLSAETAPLITADFENGIVQNKNARILYLTDAEGKKKTIFMYVFVDDSHVLITESEAAVREVITRLLGNNIAN